MGQNLERSQAVTSREDYKVNSTGRRSDKREEEQTNKNTKKYIKEKGDNTNTKATIKTKKMA